MIYKLGEVEIWRILEIDAPYLTPQELFPTAGRDVSETIEALAPGQVDKATGGLILPIQGFLLKTPNHAILVDSCVGNDKTSGTANWHQRSDNRFIDALRAAGVTPEEVDYVLCTHLHGDHVGWNTKLENGRWVPTFPNAKYLIPEVDDAYFSTQGGDTYRESVLPVIAAGQTEMVGDGHKLGDYVTLVPTPGHTPGHVSVLIKSGAREAMITGDALHTTAQCQHPEWHFKYDNDAEMAVRSRRWLLETCAETNCIVLGNHFTLPSIGHVRTEGNAFRWIDN